MTLPKPTLLHSLWLFLLASLFAGVSVRATPLTKLWAERISSTVAVEFYVETETERRETTSYGTVIDDKGTVILPPSAINLRYAPDQLRAFKMYVPGSSWDCLANTSALTPSPAGISCAPERNCAAS